ncbi:hypothetical protein JCM10449v2_004826 [Rhodotorula kratochvilovae]
MAEPALAAPAAPAADLVVPKLSSSSHEGGYSYKVTVDLELKIDSPVIDTRFPLDGVPLAGVWAIEIRREKEDNRFMAGATFERRPTPYVDHVTQIPYTGFRMTVTPQHLDHVVSNTNGAFNPSTQRKYRFIFEIRQDGLVPSLQATELAKRMGDSGTKALPNDVRIFFPSAAGRPAELWTSEALLMKTSPYFRSLFRSGLAETIPVSSKRARRPDKGSSAPRRTRSRSPADKDFVDSDDETGELTFRLKRPELHDPREGAEFPYKQVTVTQAAYSTYRAVLLWMQTFYIRFSPPSSSFLPANIKNTRANALRDAHDEDPSLPLPVSPKSVFRLAHYLELEPLETLALQHFRTHGLSLENAPVELFSELAAGHPHWRAMVLGWVVEHWDDVKTTAGWKGMMRRVAMDEVDGAGAVMVELMTSLDEMKGALPSVPTRDSN